MEVGSPSPQRYLAVRVNFLVTTCRKFAKYLFRSNNTVTFIYNVNYWVLVTLHKILICKKGVRIFQTRCQKQNITDTTWIQFDMFSIYFVIHSLVWYISMSNACQLPCEIHSRPSCYLFPELTFSHLIEDAVCQTGKKTFYQWAWLAFDVELVHTLSDTVEINTTSAELVEKLSRNVKRFTLVNPYVVMLIPRAWSLLCFYCTIKDIICPN